MSNLCVVIIFIIISIIELNALKQLPTSTSSSSSSSSSSYIKTSENRLKQSSSSSLYSMLKTNAIVGSKNLDWPNLGFEYRQTDSFVKIDYKNGQWGDIHTRTNPYIDIHIGATALHYGQACFEGLKAFHCKDGKVRIFRGKENAARIARSCESSWMLLISQYYKT
jgi:hypothetical protein